MEQKCVSDEQIALFQHYLISEERSAATVEKYLRDVRAFAIFLANRSLDRQSVLAYKSALKEEYAISSANSMLAALNSFFRFCGWHELCVRQFRVQREAYCKADRDLTKEEYKRLLATAGAAGKERLCLILQAICGTGIRVSELQYITVEALERGEATVDCKGKVRHIFLIPALCRKLRRYAREQGVLHGSVFVGRGGKPLNRSVIWREMKTLCAAACVCPSKVFPHNLRHLFAKTFYALEKDIAKLADILGHATINTTRLYIATTCAEHKRKMANMRLIL